jgi:DHA1 family tetracycline resistance protein-like MFS transporter
MSRRVEPSAQGRLQGALGSLAGVTGMLGPVIFTQIFALGISSRGFTLPGAPYLLSALLLGASCLFALVVARDSAAETA